jgi:hypothetical protein
VPAITDVVRVRAAEAGDIAGLSCLYSSVHPVQPQWLCLHDLGMADLNARYGQRGLTRQRVVYLAEAAGQVQGAITCWMASEGMNLSFMENAATDLVLDPHVAEASRAGIAEALVGAAHRHYRSLGRPITVLMIDPATDSLLSTRAFLPPIAPKQYKTLTFSTRALTLACNHIRGYYESATSQQSVETTGTGPDSMP